ncbi:MAG: hypothetical protein ACI4JE_07485 [Ruminococcus sp.]
MEIYNEFAKWLDRLLTDNKMPESTAAFNFNLYEEAEGEKLYSVQLIAADEFDEDDEDWACSEGWTSEEDLFFIDFSDEADGDWKRCLDVVCELIKEYLSNGGNAQILLDAQAVGAGFVDGEIEIISRK